MVLWATILFLQGAGFVGEAMANARTVSHTLGHRRICLASDTQITSDKPNGHPPTWLFAGSVTGIPGVPENITVMFLNPTSVRVSWSTSQVEQVEKYDVTYKPTDARCVPAISIYIARTRERTFFFISFAMIYVYRNFVRESADQLLRNNASVCISARSIFFFIYVDV